MTIFSLKKARRMNSLVGFSKEPAKPRKRSAISSKKSDPASPAPYFIQTPKLKPDPAMLHYAIVFLIVAIIAGILGFGGIAGTAAWIAKVLFLVFLVLFLVSLISGRRPVT